MKKSYLILAAVAGLLASCSNEVLVDEAASNTSAPRAIGFSTFSEKATRTPGDYDLEDYHNTFAVYATKKSTVDASAAEQYVFGDDASTAAGQKAGTTVTFNAGAVAPNDWTYSPYRYWDKQATYYFRAYAPAAAPLALSYAAAGNAVNAAANDFVTTAAYALVGQNLQGAAATEAEILTGFTGASGEDCDLMISDVVYEEGAAHNADVNLVFKHILAKLNVTVAKAAVLDAAKVNVKTSTINNLKNQGEFSDNAYDGGTYTTGWSNVDYSATPSTYVLAYNGTETTLNASTPVKPKYFIESLVMPQVIADGQSTVTLVYTIETGTAPSTHLEQYTATIDLQDAFTSFFDRYNYTLNITIQPEVITFDAGVSAWSNFSANQIIL